MIDGELIIKNNALFLIINEYQKSLTILKTFAQEHYFCEF